MRGRSWLFLVILVAVGSSVAACFWWRRHSGGAAGERLSLQKEISADFSRESTIAKASLTEGEGLVLLTDKRATVLKVNSIARRELGCYIFTENGRLPGSAVLTDTRLVVDGKAVTRRPTPGTDKLLLEFPDAWHGVRIGYFSGAEPEDWETLQLIPTEVLWETRAGERQLEFLQETILHQPGELVGK